MIEIKNLTFRYNDTDIFKEANLCLTSGMWLLEGENGQGKTTLLNLLGKQQNIYKKNKLLSSESKIIIDDSVILLDENVDIPLFFTEKELYTIIMRINGLKADKKYKTCYEKKKLAEYSVGERKYAVLNIISNVSPKVLLIDEYLTNLDSRHINDILTTLSKMEKKGTIIIISSNDNYVKSLIKPVIKIQNKELYIFEKEN